LQLDIQDIGQKQDLKILQLPEPLDGIQVHLGFLLLLEQ